MDSAGAAEGEPFSAEPGIYDVVMVAAFDVWQSNGRDVLAALWTVYRGDGDERVRLGAREAFGRARDVRWVRELFERTFTGWSG